MKKSMIILFTLVSSLAVLAQPGSLDLSFDGDGKTTTDFFGDDEDCRAVIVQPDGKIVVVGASYTGFDPHDFGVVRYNSDGTLDNSFDTDGKVSTDLQNFSDFAYGVLIQPDGKIIVAGSSSSGSDNDFALVRYNADGSLDNSFDTDGKVITNFGSASDNALAIGLQSDGKIILAGFYSNGTDQDIALARYNTNGSLDNTFDSDGKVTLDIAGGGNDQAHTVAIQSDGKIVVGGFTDNGGSDFCLIRLNANGSLDNTFDTDGKVTTAFGGGNDEGNSLIIQADGKIVLAGYTDNGTNYDYALARYNTNGSLDNTFDSDGKVTTDFSNTDEKGNALVIQADQRLVLGGWCFISGSNADFSVARYEPDGSLDLSFSADGKTTVGFASNYDYGYGMAIQPDGKIVQAGYVGSTNKNFAVARYYNGYLAVDENAVDPFQVTVFPNPFVHTTTFQIHSTNSIVEEMELKVFNPLGKLVYSQILNSALVTLSMDLPTGTYVFKLTNKTNQHHIASGKIIIQAK